MKWFLFVLSLLFLLIAGGTCAVAKSAIHEIEYGIFLLISAVCFVGFGIIDAINKHKEKD